MLVESKSNAKEKLNTHTREKISPQQLCQFCMCRLRAGVNLRSGKLKIPILKKASPTGHVNYTSAY